MSDFHQLLFNNLGAQYNSIVQQDNISQSLNHQHNYQHQGHNSFIQSNNLTSNNQNLLYNNQNITFSDHTLIQNIYHPNSYPSKSSALYSNPYHQTLHTIDQNHQNQSCQSNSIHNQKFQQKLSHSIIYPQPSQSHLQINQDFSQSFNDLSLSQPARRGAKRKILPQNLNLSHKDHMLLGTKVISGLQKNIVSLPFRQPVDVQRYNIPDYLQIIKQPMDLKTIKRKIYNQQYETVNQIYSDIQLIITNSMRYNQFNQDFVRLTRNFQKSYHKIRRDCQRNMRKYKAEQQKKTQAFLAAQRASKKITKPIQSSFPTNDVQIMSSFDLKDLAKLAKKIKKLQAQEQIQLFRRIGIINTMIIDIKTLATKQVKSLMKQVQKMQKTKEEYIRNEQKKENSHLTTCDNEYRYAA